MSTESQQQIAADKAKDFCENHGLREHFINQDLTRASSVQASLRRLQMAVMHGQRWSEALDENDKLIAALTAEREKLTEACDYNERISKTADLLRAESSRFQKALTAERQQLAEWRRAHKAVSELADGAITRRLKAESQLLSALAAIEKHNNNFNIGSSFRINVDLSLLHERDKTVLHEAEHRARLAFAASDSNDFVLCDKILRAITDDALAKVKQ